MALMPVYMYSFNSKLSPLDYYIQMIWERVRKMEFQGVCEIEFKGVCAIANEEVCGPSNDP